MAGGRAPVPAGRGRAPLLLPLLALLLVTPPPTAAAGPWRLLRGLGSQWAAGHGAGAAAAGAAALSGGRAAGAAASAGARRLLDSNIRLSALSRMSMAGAARGQRARGQPAPVPGLVNPDIPALINNKSASMEDLVLPFGYPLETYPVSTADGFVLRLYRIPYGAKNSTNPTARRPVVLLHHGVTLASSSFVVLDPDSSMGFYLADAGFDVWMVNTRGNTYSRGNKQYRMTDADYWRTSLDEMALLDLPAQIDYIIKFTGQPSMAIVGHSQGCTLPEMLLAARPEYNAKVWLLMLLGPVTFADMIKAPIMLQQAKTGGVELFTQAGMGQFIPSNIWTSVFNGCGVPPTTPWCFDLVNFLFYGPSAYVSPEDFTRISATWPATVAIRNMKHWSQLFHAASGLRMFDYGTNCTEPAGGPPPFDESCNQAKYGQPDPPTYDLGQITTKAAVLIGDNDLMGTPEDCHKLIKSWGAKMAFEKTYPNTAHMDFVWARNPIMKGDIINALWDNAPAWSKVPPKRLR